MPRGTPGKWGTTPTCVQKKLAFTYNPRALRWVLKCYSVVARSLSTFSNKDGGWKTLCSVKRNFPFNGIFSGSIPVPWFKVDLFIPRKTSTPENRLRSRKSIRYCCSLSRNVRRKQVIVLIFLTVHFLQGLFRFSGDFRSRNSSN